MSIRAKADVKLMLVKGHGTNNNSHLLFQQEIAGTAVLPPGQQIVPEGFVAGPGNQV